MSVSEQKSLKQMLNEAGYKKHSSINPLILQSKVTKIFKEYLQRFLYPDPQPDELEYWNNVTVKQIIKDLER